MCDQHSGATPCANNNNNNKAEPEGDDHVPADTGPERIPDQQHGADTHGHPHAHRAALGDIRQHA
ncbi:MAG: hypothetical protein M3381_13575 [Actinomycetota bacterium]|nr:hypothetical protein [Actinomycetota bacterium]